MKNETILDIWGVDMLCRYEFTRGNKRHNDEPKSEDSYEVYYVEIGGVDWTEKLTENSLKEIDKALLEMGADYEE